MEMENIYSKTYIKVLDSLKWLLTNTSFLRKQKAFDKVMMVLKEDFKIIGFDISFLYNVVGKVRKKDKVRINWLVENSKTLDVVINTNCYYNRLFLITEKKKLRSFDRRNELIKEIGGLENIKYFDKVKLNIFLFLKYLMR